MSGPVSTILSLHPTCLNKPTSSFFFFKKKILLHGIGVGISTLTVIADPKCHKFWVTSFLQLPNQARYLCSTSWACGKMRPLRQNPSWLMEPSMLCGKMRQFLYWPKPKALLNLRWPSALDEQKMQSNILHIKTLNAPCCLSTFFLPAPGTAEPKCLSLLQELLPEPQPPLLPAQKQLHSPLGRHRASHHKPPSLPPSFLTSCCPSAMAGHLTPNSRALHNCTRNSASN